MPPRGGQDFSFVKNPRPGGGDFCWRKKGDNHATRRAAFPGKGYVQVYTYIITIEQYGKDTFVHVRGPSEEDIKMARDGLARAREAMLSGEYDIVVFDELVTGHFFHLISLEEMLEIIKSKPDGVEVILTGRYAPPELIAAADLVTEMVEVKHYFKQGVQARDGIER
ncbi:cob(I)yrinic acid a,c-diamide adenosyltransferase [Dehalococcoidia bacterium]|nr:cob(I)yrinic acid a,c-diamide adenosyltransferase [Dehalococcoidia bacterium]